MNTAIELTLFALVAIVYAARFKQIGRVAMQPRVIGTRLLFVAVVNCLIGIGFFVAQFLLRTSLSGAIAIVTAVCQMTWVLLRRDKIEVTAMTIYWFETVFLGSIILGLLIAQ